MTHHTPPEHYKGKSVSEHLKDARRRGAIAMAETHGTELAGYLSAAFDSAKDTSISLLLLWSVATAFTFTNTHLLLFFIAFGLGMVIWKTGRSALLGWGRLERLHRIIEEERYEIEHHREQEKEELREMYEAKGFSGKMLDEVVEVLVADDNRLLRVMLEEELGLSLEVYEHPLKQAFGAFLGSLISGIVLILALYFWPLIGVPLFALILICMCADQAAKKEKRNRLYSAIWNSALGLFAGLSVYFFARLLA